LIIVVSDSQQRLLPAIFNSIRAAPEGFMQGTQTSTEHGSELLLREAGRMIPPTAANGETGAARFL